MAELSIIGVQFNTVGKVYHFSIPIDGQVELGSYVVVNTARGKQLGKVMKIHVETPFRTNDIQPIERVATSKDLMLKDMITEKETEAIGKVRNFLKDSQFVGVKALSAEYSFDYNRLTLFLNYETESGFEIKAFLREISRLFRDVRVEVRQVGPRDVAKSLSGLGACGIEKRCCSRFLTEFSSITIKMAKSQDISLTPSEITGMCGRLRCCLLYEHEMYEEARNNLPKRKKIVQTPLGEGKVIQVLPLSNSVVVELPETGPRHFTLDELETGVLADKAPKEKPITMDDLRDSNDVEMVPLESNRKPVQSNRQNKGSQAQNTQQGKPQNDKTRNASNDQPRGNRRRKRR